MRKLSGNSIFKIIFITVICLSLAIAGIYLYLQKTSSTRPSEEKESFVIPADLKVPEPGEILADKNMAVPKAVMEAARNSRSSLRSFDIVADKDAFTPNKIAVYENDIVRIAISAIDKDYNIQFERYGVKQNIKKGDTKTVEFQAVESGSFIFSCTTCVKQNANNFEAKNVRGLLMVLPK